MHISFPKGLKLALFISIGGTCVWGVASCSKSEKNSSNNDVETAPQKNRPEWSWENYQRSDELLLGTKMVSIQPKQSLEVHSESAGTLTLLTDRTRVSVPKGHLWAQMDKEKLERNKEKLEIAEEDQKLTKLKVEKFDRPEKIKNAEQELEDARMKVAQMEKLLSSKLLRKHAKDIFGEVGEVNDAKLRELKQELSLAEQKLAMVQEVDAILHKNKDRVMAMELVENRESFEDAKKKSNYEAAFSGELRLEIDYVNGQSDYSVAGRQLIATLNDYSEMHVLLNVLGESWVSLPSKSLLLRLANKEKTEVLFKEDKVVRNPRTRREEKHYVFSAVTEEHPNLKRLSGVSLSAQLVTKLPKRCWIVPKLDVAIQALGKTNSKSWPVIVDTLWPGAVVTAEGENALAIDFIPAKN